MSATQIGLEIKRKREQKGWLQSDLAANLKTKDGHPVKERWVCDLELGRSSKTIERRSVMFNDDMLLQIADHLDIDSDYAFFLCGRIPPDIWEMNLTSYDVRNVFDELREKGARRGTKKAGPSFKKDYHIDKEIMESTDPGFVSEKIYTAAISHQCIECHGIINPKNQYLRSSCLWDGKMYAFKTCLACALKWEKYLAKKARKVKIYGYLQETLSHG